jgi:hypothetical protein
MTTKKGKTPAFEEQQRWKFHGPQFHDRKPEGDRKEIIPVLKYGKGNNFYLFQEALYKKVLKDYGDLVKLIMLNKYHISELEVPSYTATGITADEMVVLRTKLMKDLAKQVGKMRADRPKLYVHDCGK